MLRADGLSPTLSFPWRVWLLVLVGLFVFNWFTQPFEDAVSLVPPAVAFYLDPVWYLDDIIGPSFFFVAGWLLLGQSKLRMEQWPVMGLGLCCLAFALGDTTDIHWFLPKKIQAAEHHVSFSSWMSKVMVVIAFGFFIIHAFERMPRAARQSAVFAFLLLYIDQIQMSIAFDFAGYAFHVFEETLEVVTGGFMCFGVARYRMTTPENANAKHP
ncbi:MAG TPA: hypothetical protein PKA51_00180 [Kiritimatiellia bacterium]|nr:hypothetical protein [Kiritimatiellia bacterium]